MCVQECRHTIVHPYTKPDSSNSNMWRHYRKHDSRLQSSTPQSQQLSLKVLFQQSSSLTTSELQHLLLQTVVTCNWPFDQFDIPIFRHLLSHGFPGHKIPRRRTIPRLLMVAAEVEEMKLKDGLNVTTAVSA